MDRQYFSNPHLPSMSGRERPPRVIRPPTLRRGKEEISLTEKVKLERVLGLTVTSNAALDCDPNSGIIAYPAGCTVVLLNPRKNKQTHLLNAGKKAISCLSFSSDGRYLATGETGHMPSVRVWDLQDRLQVAEFTGHKFAINCVAFSPTQKHVVSVGSQHDMIVNVWDWRNNAKVASNKVSSKVKAISFAENGSYFVTVGNRHVKFWYLEHSRGSSKFKEPVPLMGRSAILGEQRNNYFCDVACGRGEMGDSTFAITKSGLLCEFNSRRLLDKWVELRTSSANCLVVGEEYIFIGCADGIVRCFSPLTLQFVTTLPRTHYLGVDVARGLTISHMASQPVNAKYPDAIAVTLDEANHKVTCIYSDHSMYIWDVHDIRRVGKSYSFLFHSACIWGVEVYPVMEGGYKGVLPPGSFMTCSSDDTIRVWNLDPNMANNTLYKRNIYSNDLLKVLYMDSDYTYLCDVNQSFSGSTEKTDSSCDGKNGVRCLCVRPDGKHLASGDRTGNIRIHELQFMDEICKIEAHDAEVLCLEYCKQGQTFLASASRDRLIHLFDVGKDYSLHQTLDDHSSSITAVRFVTAHGEPLLLSCGADKSIIFRRSQQALGQKGGPQYSRFHHVSGKTTLYDMELDLSRKHILTACQDRNIRVYNVSNGKHSKTFKGTLGEEGTLIKLVLDRSGMYIATSCTDKSLCIYDYYNGECMATMFGHSELVTGLRFSNDCRHLISVSGDGCIFIWKIPTEMTQAMTSRLAQLASKHGRRATHSIPRPFGGPGHDLISASAVDLLDQNANDVEESEYRFSIGQLPLWAKKQIAEAHSPPLPMGRGGPELPKGRWAQRIESQAITVRSHYDSDSVIPLPIPQGDSESSKDSSLESSGSEVRHFSADYPRQTLILSKEEPDADFIPCPDNYQKITREIPDFELSGGRITLKRGSAFSETRSRHLTDDSSSSSFKFEEGETEHDGDVEDSENEDGESPDLDQPEPLLYLPQSQEPASDFLVKETDQEELRKSQRRHRKARAEKPLDISIISASASQESEEEDGDVSTPSAETAERNIMSMLAISTESLDQVALRETFLKSNFETLHDDRGGFQSGSETSENTSLSSRFLRQNSRNSDIIEAAKQSLKDPEISRRRLELQRQIEETRKKLQSVGYKSNLNTSRSITDLSSVPEKEDSSRYKGGGRNGGEGGLRRACSLSDLSQPSPAQRRILPSPPNQVSGKATTGKPGQGHVKSIRNPAFPNGYERNDNPSDSEGEIPSVHRSSGVVTMSRMTRPTMSSMQKQQGHMGGRGTARGDRVGPKSSQHSSFAKSTGDLRRPAEGYSSSEETSSNENKPKPSKSSGLTPASRRISSSEKELNRTAREVTDRLNVPRGAVEKRNVRRASSVITGGNGPAGGASNPRIGGGAQTKRGIPSRPKSLDIAPSSTSVSSSLPCTRQGCEEASENLKEASETLATLYQRVSMDLSFNEVERASFLAILQAGAQEARMTLDSIMYPMNPGSGETSRKGSTNNPVMMQMMQQYSDLLVNMVQQRMQSPASSSSTLMASADNTEEVIAVNGHEAPPVSQALTPS